MLASTNYQIPKTTDVLSILIASIVIILLCLKIGWSFNAPKYSETIKAEAIIYAYQIWELQINLTDQSPGNSLGHKSGARGIASGSVAEKQGVIGRDPWQNPYNYLIRTSEDSKKYIVVWSIGPDGKNNSYETLSTFSGDDLGESLVTNL
jgi:hypothetical protein